MQSQHLLDLSLEHGLAKEFALSKTFRQVHHSRVIFLKKVLVDKQHKFICVEEQQVAKVIVSVIPEGRT